jgi:hypothetical protein
VIVGAPRRLRRRGRLRGELGAPEGAPALPLLIVDFDVLGDVVLIDARRRQRAGGGRLRAVQRRPRLRGWTITSVSCKLTTGGRASCAFAARRRGFRLSGSGTVSRRPSGTALAYRLTARISRTGCRPAAGSRCTRRAVWRS